MTERGDSKGLKMNGPPICWIRVQGTLKAGWSECMENMSITIDSLGAEKPVTTLVGDQAALSDVLNTLYEMRLPVLSVECVGKKGSQKMTDSAPLDPMRDSNKRGSERIEIPENKEQFTEMRRVR